MSGVEIIVGHSWKEDVRFIDSLRSRRPSETVLDLLELRDVIDIVVDGNNLTASIPEEAIFGLVADLCGEVLKLLDGEQTKGIVEFHHEPWEMALVPEGSSLLLSLYSVDRRQLVLCRDLKIGAAAFADALADAGEEMLTALLRVSDHFSAHGQVRELSQALARLRRQRRVRFPGVAEVESREGGERLASSSLASGLTVSFSFDGDDRALRGYRGEHVFDLHALLFGGQVRAELGEEEAVLAREYPFLTIVSLLDRCRQLFNQLEGHAHQPFVIGEALPRLGLEVHGEGSRWRVRGRDATTGEWSEVMVSPVECLDSLVSLGEVFLQEVLRVNPHLEVNQRFLDVADEAEKLRHWFSDLCEHNLYHDRPEAYLRELGDLKNAPVEEPEELSFPWPLSAVQALFPRRAWTMDTRGIDLSGLRCTPAGVVVPCAGELRCVKTETGRTRWTVPMRGDLRSSGTAQAGPLWMVRQPGGLAAVNGESGEVVGELSTEAWGGGEWTRLRGAAYYPTEEMVVVVGSGGETMAMAVGSGAVRSGAQEPLWEIGSSAPGRVHGVAVEGPLICVENDEGVVTALNPRTGEVVWRIRIPGSPVAKIESHQGRIYVVHHDPLRQASTVTSLYPFTGRTVWQVRLPGFCAGVPTFVDRWMMLPVERRGQITLAALDLEAVDPRVIWQIPLASAGVDRPTPVMASRLDGRWHGWIRTDRAEVTCFRLSDGEVRWQVMPADGNLLLYGAAPLRRLREALVNVSTTVDLRNLSTGELLHSLPAIEAPEFGAFAPPFSVILGETGPEEEDVDRLTCFDMSHFLAVVE